LATIATLYITPVAYLLLAGLSKPKAAEAARLHRELSDAIRRAEPAE
jgi:HAE1 family hydrophobic/amphiphilic exporter-1